MSNKYNTRLKIAVELDTTLTGLEDSFINKLSIFFNGLKNNIIKESDNLDIFKEIIDKDKKAEFLKLKGLMNSFYKTVGKEVIKHTNEEIKELTGKSSDIRMPDINPDLRYRAEKLAKQKLKDYRNHLKEQVLKQNIPNKEKKELIKSINSASKQFINRHVTIVSRMESVTVANQQRLELFRKSRIIKGVQFLAVIDKRTTQICTSRHQMILKLDDPKLPNFTPPCHFGCRSLLSGVTMSESLEITSDKELESVPKTQFQEQKDKAREEINIIRDKKVGQLNLEELKKVSYWELDNAKNIIKNESDFKPFINHNSGMHSLIAGLKRESKDLEKNLSIISNENIEKTSKLYSNTKGLIRELQIVHKMIMDKVNIKFASTNFGRYNQEIDISFEKNKIDYLGEVKSGGIRSDYFDYRKNKNFIAQGYKLIATSLEKDMELIFFLEIDYDRFKDFLESQEIVKKNPNFRYKMIKNKDFLKDYPYF